MIKARLGFEWLLAWRIVRSRKSRFLSIITVVAVVGIAFGVIALTTVLSVTGGFEQAFRDRILGLHPHLLVWPRDDEFTGYREAMAALSQDPRILGVTPATYDEMMMAHGDHRAGAVVKGVDPATSQSVLDIQSLVTSGSMGPLDETPSVRIEGDVAHIGNLVQETSWLVVLTGPRTVAVVEEPLTSPLPDEAHVSIVHADPALGTLDVALRGTTEVSVRGLQPGHVSRVLTVPAGALDLEIGGHPLVPAGIDLAPGKAYVLVLGAAGATQLHEASAGRPGENEARLRVLDARAAGAPGLRVESDGEVLSAGETRVVGARPPAVLLGSALAERLKAGIGDRVAIASPFRGLGDRGGAPTGMEPTSGRFEVAGVFQSGYYDYDKRFAVVSFGAALRFLNSGDRAKWLEVKVDDVFRVDERRQVVQDILQPYTVGDLMDDVEMASGRVDSVLRGEVSQLPMETPDSLLGYLRNSAQVLSVLRTTVPHTFGRSSDYAIITWQQVNQPLFAALKLQKVVLSIIFLIIIVVAAFNIVGTQIMLVHQKTREIAILKAMGARAWSVKKVFLVQGLIVSLLGTAIGLVIGVGICVLLKVVGYPLEPEVYLIDRLPVSIDVVEIVLIVVSALCLTLLATLYSAGRAGRLLPVDGIRYIE